MKSVVVAILLIASAFLSGAGTVDASTPAPLLVTNGNDDGAGSLRSAIRDAAPNSIVEITFTGVILLTSGELLLDKNLTVAGPGPASLTITCSSQAGGFRILEVNSTATVDLSGLTLSGGHPVDVAGGAVLNGGTLTLHNVRVADNGPIGSGFPVQNTVNGGGCMNSAGATLVITNCSIVGNHCNGSGGGILNSGNLTIKESTVSGNGAGYGGGVFSGGTMTMSNCTVSGNGAISTGPHGLQGGYGGGLLIGGSAELTSDTISANGCVWHGGGISLSGTVSMTSCLVAANTSESNPQDGDMDGIAQSHGYNLIGISTGNNGFGSTDLMGTPSTPLDSKLGPLQDNGGSTFTMALLPGSPAIDHGLNDSSAMTDQRGMPRKYEQSAVTNSPGGDGSDVGAFELGSRIATFGNISTRLSVGLGDNALIGGFIITGTQPKAVIVRGMGPSLPVPGTLADPVIEVHGSAGELLATNDNWNDEPENGQHLIENGLAPSNAVESARWGILNPGAYTVVVRGKNNAAGVGLFEVYDLDQTVDSKLANISTRGFVNTGDNVMIGGTIVIGSTQAKVLVRAIGPSLANFGIPNALPDPALELHDGNGASLAANDNWRTDQEAEIMGTGIPPSDNLESAILANLPPGAYTAIVRGVGNSTGVALVEAYQLQ
jgi:hypothetical protein